MVNTDSIEQELDRLYEFEISRYIERCDELKKAGYRIFRNESGQHKVVGNGRRVEKRQRSYGYDESTDKKENFLIRIKRGFQNVVATIKAMIRLFKAMHNNKKNNMR